MPTPHQRSEINQQNRDDHVITRTASNEKITTDRSASVENIEKLHNVEKSSTENVKTNGTSNSQDEETNSKSGTSPSFMENFSKSERDMLIQINSQDKSEIVDPTDMVGFFTFCTFNDYSGCKAISFAER